MRRESYSEQKSDVHTFFAKGRMDVPASDQLKEDLRQELFQHYINYYSPNDMEEVKKQPFYRRRPAILAGGIALLLLIVVPAIVFFAPEIKNRISNDKLGAEIAYIEGEVEYKENDDGWKSASTNLVLKEGYSIRVLGEGRAIVNLDDGSAIRLNNDSSVTLASMDPDSVVINNNGGEIYSRVAKADREFKVVAGGVTYESLGTAYKTVNSENKNGVEVYQSQVKVIEEEKTINEGEKYYVKDQTKPEAEKKVTQITAEEINKDQFVQWNKDQDLLITEYKDKLGVLGDTTPPALTVNSPKDGDKTQSDKVTVSGTTETGAKVKVNGTEVENKEGKFSKEVSLKEGVNEITVIALDSVGNKASKIIKVTREIVSQQTTPQPQPQPQPESAYISLGGHSPKAGKILVTWEVHGSMDISKGFKVVYGPNANPVYPGNDYQYLSDPSARSAAWAVAGGTYHIRVCQYLGGSCGIYSNDLVVTVEDPTPVDPLTSITLIGTGGANVSWSVTGTPTNIFKLVWSDTNTNPTYGGADIDGAQAYDKTARAGTISGTAGVTYHVRVCGYVNTICDVQSNVIDVTL